LLSVVLLLLHSSLLTGRVNPVEAAGVDDITAKDHDTFMRWVAVALVVVQRFGIMFCKMRIVRRVNELIV
jgi:hypothetical protein